MCSDNNLLMDVHDKVIEFSCPLTQIFMVIYKPVCLPTYHRL